MSNSRGAGPISRQTAVDDLFFALHELMERYAMLPEPERSRRRAADAELITGQVGRHLAVARGRISSTFTAPVATDGVALRP